MLFLIYLSVQIEVIAGNYTYNLNNYRATSHKHNESSYQHVWCSAHNGVEEFQNKDFTRVDCLTDKNAVEFDFSNKWAESIGQALHYQYMTGKRAKVVLILDDIEKEMVYFKRVENLAKIYNFDVEYVTSDILCIKNGKCPYSDCKCKRQKYQYR